MQISAAITTNPLFFYNSLQIIDAITEEPTLYHICSNIKYIVMNVVSIPMLKD